MFQVPCSMRQPQQLSNKPEKWRLSAASPAATFTGPPEAEGAFNAVLIIL